MCFSSPLLECSLLKETDVLEGKDSAHSSVFVCAESSANYLCLFLLS